jgi:hypothetical protein
LLKSMNNHFAFALKNIAKYGDTDIFPFPMENKVFFDLPAESLAALDKIQRDFDKAIKETPPIFEKALSVSGYNGFRPASQLDPLWNAYLLGLVSSISDNIEKCRVPQNLGIVYSYRVNRDEEKYLFFDPKIGWTEFQLRSIELARTNEFVLCCDISDFYPRIYHHQLENALDKTKSDPQTVNNIMNLLNSFSSGVSYGLPVGGPAARLLSELLLNRTDRQLLANKINFCRFVDDYRIFTKTKAEAYQVLLLLSKYLLDNEGLTLQKHKTRIISKDEYIATNPLTDSQEDAGSEHAQAGSLLKVRLRFDPYSVTADQDYENLREIITKYDIVGILAKEIRKSQIDESLTRKLIQSIKFINGENKQKAILTLMDNLEVLYPLFGQIMITLHGTYEDLSSETKTSIQKRIGELITNNSHITSVTTHLAYAIRLLAQDESFENDAVLTTIYKQETSMIIRRDIILAMAKRNSDFWLTDRRKTYDRLTEWEKTAMVMASYKLGDEGSHWRRSQRGKLSPMAELAAKWVETKIATGSWEIPL